MSEQTTVKGKITRRTVQTDGALSEHKRAGSIVSHDLKMLKTLSDQGGRFCRVYHKDTPKDDVVSSPGKQPIGGGWQKKPYDHAQIKGCIERGDSVGLICGYGNFAILDIDERYREFCERFLPTNSSLIAAPTVVRDGADKAKIIIRIVGGLPRGRKFRHNPDESPYFEVLSTNNQGVLPPSIHPGGMPYVWKNADRPIPALSPKTLNTIVKIWTNGECLHEFEPETTYAPNDDSDPEEMLEVERRARLFIASQLVPKKKPGYYVCPLDHKPNEPKDFLFYVEPDRPIGGCQGKHDKMLTKWKTLAEHFKPGVVSQIAREVREDFIARHNGNPPAPRPGPGRDGGEVAAPAKSNGYLFKRNDVANAQRLLARHGESLRFSNAFGWLAWDGKRWERNNLSAQAMAQDTAEHIIEEAALAGDNDDLAEAMRKFANSSKNTNRLRNMLTEAAPHVQILPDDLDGQHSLLNVQNGTIDLETGKLLPHDKTHLFTKISNVEYDPKAECPMWDKFVDQIMGGNGSLVIYQQTLAGYCATGHTIEQILPILIGLGANGKTVYMGGLRGVLGSDFAIGLNTSAIVERNTNTIPNDIARLKGARLAITQETEKGQYLSESIVKELTGSDLLSARFLKQEWFDFVPTHKIVLSSNNKPIIRGRDRAIWRRLKLIPFTVTIPSNEQDKYLSQKLRAEYPGILRWIVEGAVRWHKEGLREPGEIASATAAYKDEMNRAASFFDDNCVFGEHYWTLSKSVWEQYQAWVKETKRRYPMTRGELNEAIKEKGCEPKKISRQGGRGWQGIGLLSLTTEQ